MTTNLNAFPTVQNMHGKLNKAKAKLFFREFLQDVQKIRITHSAGLILKNIFFRYLLHVVAQSRIANMSPIKLCYTTEGINKFRNRCLANVTKSGSLVASNLAGKGRRGGWGGLKAIWPY